MAKKMIGAAALAVGFATALVIAGSAWAQQPESQTLQLTPSRDSGVSGTATLTDTDGGVQVQLSVQGLPKDGAEHIAHIHRDASCSDDRADNGGPVEYPLESVTAQPDGTGSSTTVIPDVTLAQLLDGTRRYVNVHDEQSGEGTPPGIACADLPSAGTQGQAKMEETVKYETTQPLPKSGGVPVGSVLLPAAALLLGGGVLGYAALRKRR